MSNWPLAWIAGPFTASAWPLCLSTLFCERERPRGGDIPKLSAWALPLSLSISLLLPVSIPRFIRVPLSLVRGTLFFAGASVFVVAEDSTRVSSSVLLSSLCDGDVSLPRCDRSGYPMVKTRSLVVPIFRKLWSFRLTWEAGRAKVLAEHPAPLTAYPSATFAFCNIKHGIPETVRFLASLRFRCPFLCISNILGVSCALSCDLPSSPTA